MLQEQVFMNFNSNMVRLKESATEAKTAAELYFNSNMVRLKGGAKSQVKCILLYFNSNMVRLKVSMPIVATSLLYISIPIWCD